MDESRKAFEQWWEEWFGEAPLTPWDELWCGDGFSAEDIDHMWDAWKGSRAAIEIIVPDVEKWRSVDAVRAQTAYKSHITAELSAAGIRVKE